jgi:hypothetical protein
VITVGEVFHQIPTKVMQFLTAVYSSNPAIAVGVVLVALGMALSWLAYRMRDARQSGTGIHASKRESTHPNAETGDAPQSSTGACPIIRSEKIIIKSVFVSNPAVIVVAVNVKLPKKRQ